MEDNSEEEKQNFLRENIIDKGYDADEFVSFLAEKKGIEIEEGIDLNDFSLDELKSLVQDFIVANSKEGEKQIENNPQIQNNYQENINITNSKNITNPLQSQNQIQEQTTPPIMNINQNMNIISNNNINTFNNLNIAPNSNNITNINNLNMNANNNNIDKFNNINMNMNTNNNNIDFNKMNISNNNNISNFNNLNIPNNNNINNLNNLNKPDATNVNNLNNFNMGMNVGINMNMNFNMNNNLTINNNINNNLNNNNMVQNISNTANNNINIQNNKNYNEQSDSMDVYGITNVDSISCSIIEKSELSKYENIKIEMSLGEKKAGKIFSKSYMNFIISTSPLNFNVKRRYSDFEWLRQILLHLYSSNIIPPIPKKNKIGGGRFDELFLLKRKRNLEKFLNCLLDDPYIKYSQILYDFLSIEKENEFNDKKKYYNTLKIPKNLTEYKSPNGKLEVNINEENELYYKSIKEYTDTSQDLLTKFNKNIKLLNNEMSVVVNRLEQISQICEELFFKSIKYYDIDNIKISYYQLKNMFKDWSNILKKQSCIINVNIREYFKYTRNTFRSIKDLTNIVDNYKDNYYKSKKNLITKKEELFKKNDPKKWDLNPNKYISFDAILKDKNIALQNMLFKETNNVIDIKNIYGYYLNRILTEYLRIRKLNGEGQKQNVSQNAKFQTSIISELFKNISDIASSNSKYDIKNIEKELNISII